MSLEETRESRSLPLGTSAQETELFALTGALELGEGKRINVHAHAAIWKERRMLSA